MQTFSWERQAFEKGELKRKKKQKEELELSHEIA